MKTIKISFIFLLISSIAVAQEYAFKVLANKGANSVKSGADWVPLKTGASLKSGDELKISENAYLGLVHVKGKPLELKKAGNYKVADLEAGMKPGTSVVNKYTDFILSNAEGQKSNLAATGAVDRGEKHAIKLMLPDNQKASIFNNIAIVNWQGTEVPGPYTVTVRNMFDDELNKFDTNETTFQIDMSDQKYAKENAVLIEVKSKSDPKMISKSHLIKRLAPGEQAGIKKSLIEISNDVSEQTALNKLILASFYEENNLLIDAITAYEEAIKIAPDVPSFKEAYDEFLVRQGLK